MLRMENIKKLNSSTINSSVKTNVIINLIRTLTLTVLSFITFPYVTRALGENVFGLYTWANTFVYYFLILAKISIPNIAIRECSKVKNDKQKLSNLAQQFFILQSITTLASFMLMTSLICSVPSLMESRELIFLLSINFLSGVFSFEWIYIVLEKHFYISVRSILLIAFGSACTFFFIRKTENAQNEIFIYALITISYTALTSIFNCLFISKFITFKKCGEYNFKVFIRPLLTLFFISFALTLYNQTDEFLLGFFDESKAAVGAYGVGVKGVDIIITIITSLYAVFMPRATYYYGKKNKFFYQNLLNYSFSLTIFIALPAVITMASLAPQITSLISGNYISNEYADAKWILVGLASMMLTYSIADNIYTQILLPQKKEKIYLYSMLFGVILNISLSFLFGLVILKDHPGIGVAIATGLSDLLVLIFIVYKSWNYSSKAIFNKNTLKLLIGGIIIALISIFLPPVIEKMLPYTGNEVWLNYLFTMIIIVAIDGVIYIGFLYFSKEKIVSSILRRKDNNA